MNHRLNENSIARGYNQAAGSIIKCLPRHTGPNEILPGCRVRRQLAVDTSPSGRISTHFLPTPSSRASSVHASDHSVVYGQRPLASHALTLAVTLAAGNSNSSLISLWRRKTYDFSTYVLNGSKRSIGRKQENQGIRHSPRWNRGSVFQRGSRRHLGAGRGEWHLLSRTTR